MNKAAFIDRDGVINNDTGHYYIFKPEDFIFNNDIPEAFKLLKNAGYMIIIITNQGGVSKGIYTKSDVENTNKFMLSELSIKQIEIDDILYCPHHSDNEQCLCRKPNPLMIQKAIARYNIDKKASFMIGDNMKDIYAAEAAEIKGFKINKNTSILPLVKEIVKKL